MFASGSALGMTSAAPRSPALPSPREVITAIVDSATPDARSALLTLHALFPAALLPALDLLDRGLVTKLLIDTGSGAGDAGLGGDGENACEIDRVADSETYRAPRAVEQQQQQQQQYRADGDVDVDVNLPRSERGRLAAASSTGQRRSEDQGLPLPPTQLLSQFSTAHAILALSQQQQEAVSTDRSFHLHGTVASTTTPSAQETSPSRPPDETITQKTRQPRDLGFFIVRSAQTPSGYHRHRNNPSSTSSTFHNTAAADAAGETTSGLGRTFYEVRLQAWNCSCAAFTFAAFPAAPGSPNRSRSLRSGSRFMTAATEAELQDQRAPAPTVVDRGGLDSFGGLACDSPVCKHLLACLLAERGGRKAGNHDVSFAKSVEEKVVSAEEIAGWAAGFGD